MPDSISLCVPVYRSADFLPWLFARLQALRPGPAEVIFLDDASPDESCRLIQQYINSVPSGCAIRLVTNRANTGIAAAYNRLAREARSDWVHILDADDYPVETDFYARIQSDLQPSRDVVVAAVRSNSRLIDYSSLALGWLVPRAPPHWWPLLGSFATRSGVLYRRQALLEQPFDDPAYPGSDVVHLLRLRRERRCSFVSGAHIYYRVHASATSSTERDYGRYRAALDEFGLPTRLSHRLDLALRTAGQRIAR